MRLRRLVCFAALAGGTMAAEGRPDVTGTWMLDAAQSRPGSEAAPTSETMTISKSGKTLHIARKTIIPNGERSTEYDCKTDGRFHPVAGPTGGSVLCKWEGSTLVTEREWNAGQNVDRTRFTVTPEGNTAAETVSSKASGGATTLVWKKQ